MPTLHVRNVPADLYERLRKQAALEHRSLSAEVIMLLDRYARPRPKIDDAFFDQIQLEREELERKFGKFPLSEELIRADRDR